jgi:hypothetical protein
MKKLNLTGMTIRGTVELPTELKVIWDKYSTELQATNNKVKARDILISVIHAYAMNNVTDICEATLLYEYNECTVDPKRISIVLGSLHPVMLFEMINILQYTCDIEAYTMGEFIDLTPIVN